MVYSSIGHTSIRNAYESAMTVASIRIAVSYMSEAHITKGGIQATRLNYDVNVYNITLICGATVHMV